MLGGENVDLKRMLGDISEIVGRKAPTIRLPRQAIFPVAYLAEATARLTGREPMTTLDGLRMAKYRMYFSSAKAQRDLGYRARPYGEALQDAIDWFRAAGRLR